MYRNKFISLLLIFALSMPFLTLPVEPAGASDYLEEIWGSAYKFEGDEIPIADLSDLADIDFNQIKMNHLGELVVPYADKIGQQNVATSVYYKDGAEVSKAVYGEIGIKLPRIISGEGGFIIIKRNGNLIESPAVETLWLPLIGDTTKPHHHKDNPLQKVSVAWKTEYDWVKLDIVPRSSADMDLSNSSTMNNLKLNPRMYNPTTKVLYSDIGKSEGQLRMADGAPLKIDSTKFIVPSNNLLTINYADSLATVQDTCYAEYGIIILSPEGAGEIKNVIIKAEEKEAYYTTSRYGGIPVPLLSDRTIPYNAATNPIYKEIEIAWQFAGEDTWESALIKFVSKTDDFFKGAKTYTASLKLHPSLYDPDSKIIYSDASQESGELKAQDGTSITRDNLISQSGGIITVNYADTFVTVTQEVYGQDTSGHLLLQLPENIADTDPRFIMQVGDLQPELITIAGDFLAVPLLDKARNLQDAVIAWRSKTEGWFKVTIKPQKEYKKPQVISVHPTGEIVDESAFSPETINGKERYFLRVVFADDGGLTYDSSLIGKMHLTDIFAVGGSRQTMLDGDLLEYASKLTSEEREAFIERYLFRKEAGTASLYIPVRKLLAQANYNVEVPSGLVYYPEGVGNDLIMWSFGTIGSPQITDISIGSIAEDYDVREPILIYGDYFVGSNIDVKFNDIKAYEVRLKEQDGKYYLE
ncbi:MAG TPA: hypothetical protein VFD02_05690, partial [Syntrophomonadaceae bacterium]|nr:hypothetical protein [Syntrophomonadaceae bacterium]